MSVLTGSRLLSSAETAALRPHPLSAIMPLLPNDLLASLIDDMQRNGMQMPIVLYEGLILDGRNRQRVLAHLGREARVVDYVGDDPREFVLSVNTQRRALSASQRAIVAAGLVTTTQGRHAGPADYTQAMAASRMNVSLRNVHSARRLMDANNELAQRVLAGELKLARAMAIAFPPEDREPSAEIHIDPHPPMVATPAPVVPMGAATELARILECDPGEWALALPADIRSTLVRKLDDFARRAYDVLDESSLI